MSLTNILHNEAQEAVRCFGATCIYLFTNVGGTRETTKASAIVLVYGRRSGSLGEFMHIIAHVIIL